MSQASVHYFQKNQVIFYENTPNTSLYKIISGVIAFYENYGTADEKLIGTSVAPNYFGMMSVLAGQPTVYTAVAMETSAVLYLPQTQLETFPKSDSANALACMQTLAGELCAADERYNALIGELRHIACAGTGAEKALTALLSQYGEAERRIFDAYDKPEPPKAATVQPIVKSVVAVPQKTTVHMPEPYPEGHRGYPGVTRPEDGKYILKHEYTCPNCRQKFSGEKILTSKLIPVRNTAEENRFDLRVRYNDFEMEWHEIVTCPDCYFSALENFFRDSKSLYRSRYEENLQTLRESIRVEFGPDQDLDSVFARHYLALVCAPGFTDWRQINAHVWMNLVRLYEDAGDAALAELAEKAALEAYETVYKEVELSEGQEQRLCLMVAGILYARGEKLRAREWAMRVRHGSGDRSAYWNMAEQLIQDVRAEMDELKK